MKAFSSSKAKPLSEYWLKIILDTADIPRAQNMNFSTSGFFSLRDQICSSQGSPRK